MGVGGALLGLRCGGRAGGRVGRPRGGSRSVQRQAGGGGRLLLAEASPGRYLSSNRATVDFSTQSKDFTAR